MSPPPAVSAGPPEGFDWERYLALNEDLVAAGIDSEEKALRHWREFGEREGRCHRVEPGFDWRAYLAANEDLVAAGVDSEEAAWTHWHRHGRREGRPSRRGAAGTVWLEGFPGIDRLVREKVLHPYLVPLRLDVSPRHPRRVSLLIESPSDVFGGYVTTYHLAALLARRGFRVRLVLFMHDPARQRNLLPEVSAWDGLGGFLDAVEVEDHTARDRALSVHPDDRFVARSVWGAHVAAAAVAELGGPPFVFLVQDYEPIFYPHDAFHAMALAAYRLRYRALVSTPLLLEYLARHPATGPSSSIGVGEPVVFRNPVLAGPCPPAAELASRTARRLLFYVRPHGRNLFELGYLALVRALERGAFAGTWSFAGIGSPEKPASLPLAAGRTLDVLPRVPLPEYARLLPGFDVGLALMLSPHPSLVPLEMAAAGLVTVTNGFANKTPARLEAISRNLVAAEPHVETIAGALLRAAARAGDGEARVAGAAVDWPRTWEEAFDERVVTALDTWLAPDATSGSRS